MLRSLIARSNSIQGLIQTSGPGVEHHKLRGRKDFGTKRIHNCIESNHK